MCQKVKGCNRQIDLCLRKQINTINNVPIYNFKTISSCCGHGKYRKTIIIKYKDNSVFEYYSGIRLHDYDPKKDKRHNSYYKKDTKGFYYIPELLNTELFNLGQYLPYQL